MWNITIDGPRNELYVRHNGSFIARFKYACPKASANDFIKFLKANFTPEEYLAKQQAGMAPITILSEKGYVSYNVRRLQKLNS